MNFLNSKLTLICCTILILSCSGIMNGSEISLGKIDEDIYSITLDDINTGFFKFNNKIYIVDTFLLPSLSKTQKKLIRSIYKKEKFEFLINTNIDIDTIGGNQVFANETSILSTNDARSELSENGEKLLLLAIDKIEKKELKKVKIKPANFTFQKELKLYDDEMVIEIIDTQNVYGKGNLIVNLKGENVLFAGNMFFNKIIPDLKDSKIRDYLKELVNITKMSVSKIIPRHGEVGNFDDFLTYKEYIDLLISETQKFVKEGKSIEETLDGVNFEKFKNWKYYAERHPVNVQKAYDELQSENNQILEFLKAIQQQKKSN